jgi:hypothetical protein
MIKEILDEIAAESGSNMKMTILRKYEDNTLLRVVLYLACSKRIKFYLKQIPEYTTNGNNMPIDWALEKIADIYNREVTGHDAIKYLKSILEGLSPDDAHVIERIVKKNIKIGMGTSNINKVFKGLIEKTPYMGAKSYSEKLARKVFEKETMAFSQVKMDGRYANCIIQGGEADLVSRQGETTHVGDAKFLTELKGLSDCVVNGELTIDGLDRYTANGVVASIVDIEGGRESRGEEGTKKKIEAFTVKHGLYQEAIDNIRYTIWDVITIDEYFDKKSTSRYCDRLFDLTILIHEDVKFERLSVVEYEVVGTFEDAMAHFQMVLKRGDEGTILKSYTGIWKDGKPNH